MASFGLTCRGILLLVTVIVCFHKIVPLNTTTPQSEDGPTGQRLLPTVVISTLVRNKAHTLPWFLGLIEKLDYPKDRIALWYAFEI